MKRKYKVGIILIVVTVLYIAFFCPLHYGQKVTVFSQEGDSMEVELDLYLFRNRLEFSTGDGFQAALGDRIRGTFTADGEVYALMNHSGKYAFSQDRNFSFVTRKNHGTDSWLNVIYAWIDLSGGLDGLRICFVETDGVLKEYYGKEALRQPLAGDLDWSELTLYK